MQTFNRNPNISAEAFNASLQNIFPDALYIGNIRHFHFVLETEADRAELVADLDNRSESVKAQMKPPVVP